MIKKGNANGFDFFSMVKGDKELTVIQLTFNRGRLCVGPLGKLDFDDIW